jgi:hypothetical protein
MASKDKRPRRAVLLALAGALCLLLVTSAAAKNVVGTAKNDVLRGTAKAVSTPTTASPRAPRKTSPGAQREQLG